MNFNSHTPESLYLNVYVETLNSVTLLWRVLYFCFSRKFTWLTQALSLGQCYKSQFSVFHPNLGWTVAIFSVFVWFGVSQKLGPSLHTEFGGFCIWLSLLWASSHSLNSSSTSYQSFTTPWVLLGLGVGWGKRIVHVAKF